MFFILYLYISDWRNACTAVIFMLWATSGPDKLSAKVVFVRKAPCPRWKVVMILCVCGFRPCSPSQISCVGLKPTANNQPNIWKAVYCVGANRNYGAMNHGLWQQCSWRPSRKPKGTLKKLMVFRDFSLVILFSPFKKHEKTQGIILRHSEGQLTLTLVTQP